MYPREQGTNRGSMKKIGLLQYRRNQTSRKTRIPRLWCLILSDSLWLSFMKYETGTWLYILQAPRYICLPVASNFDDLVFSAVLKNKENRYVCKKILTQKSLNSWTFVGAYSLFLNLRQHKKK